MRTTKKSAAHTKNEQLLKLQVTDGLVVSIRKDQNHEFLMTSEEVANGYGISTSNLRNHKQNRKRELVEGKHFISGVRFTDSEPANKIYWTKRGVVRLGFFVDSERAEFFRDWAEDLIISKLEAQPKLFDIPANMQLQTPRKHNRLTQERLVRLMAKVCRIEDTELRLSIIDDLEIGGNHVG